MENSESEGLGLSVLVYMGAIMGVLGVLATPIYFAVRPQVYENPVLARANPLLSGPIVGGRVSARVPVALLKREQLVDPTSVAVLNTLRKATPRRAPQTVAHRASGTPVAELQPERSSPGFSLFRLFGG